MCDRIGVEVTGVDACRGGWAAVSLTAGSPAAGRPRVTVSVGPSLRAALEPGLGPAGTTIVGIDMPLGLLESGWREADRVARGLLGPRRSSVFAIPPGAVWAQMSYPAANQLCRELTGQGLSVQAWGLRAKLLEANQYRDACEHPMYSKHTAAGRELRRELLARAGIALPASPSGNIPGTRSAGCYGPAPVTDTLDAAAVAWSAGRIATGQAVILPDRPQRDSQGRQITIRY
jgi:predicted RNase H-like nuclease